MLFSYRVALLAHKADLHIRQNFKISFSLIKQNSIQSYQYRRQIMLKYSTDLLLIRHIFIPNMHQTASDNLRAVFPVTFEQDVNFQMTDSIVPCIRRIKIHDYCYAIYSTLHKVALAVHELLIQYPSQNATEYQYNSRNIWKVYHPKQREDRKFYINSDTFLYTWHQGTDIFAFFQKGHLAPTGNYGRYPFYRQKIHTFVNCIPQPRIVNVGYWQVLQFFARELKNCCEFDEMEMISGPVYQLDSNFDRQSQNYHNSYEKSQLVLLENGLMVPPKLYKIIKAKRNQSQTYVIAFRICNDNSRPDELQMQFQLGHYVVEVEELEKMTGLRFNLPSCVRFPANNQFLASALKKPMKEHLSQMYNYLYKKYSGSTNGAGRVVQNAEAFKIIIDLNSVSYRTRQSEFLRSLDDLIEEERDKVPTSFKTEKILQILTLGKNALNLQIKICHKKWDLAKKFIKQSARFIDMADHTHQFFRQLQYLVINTEEQSPIFFKDLRKYFRKKEEDEKTEEQQKTIEGNKKVKIEHEISKKNSSQEKNFSLKGMKFYFLGAFKNNRSRLTIKEIISDFQGTFASVIDKDTIVLLGEYLRKQKDPKDLIDIKITPKFIESKKTGALFYQGQELQQFFKEKTGKRLSRLVHQKVYTKPHKTPQ